MIPKTYPIQVWFLSEDLAQSAKMLPDKQLESTIKGCADALVAAKMYAVGVRSPRMYKMLFSKERLQQTLEEKFPSWPFSRKPLYSKYSTKTSKWCRMCQEHVSLVLCYLDILLQEHEFRFKKQHPLWQLSEWAHEAGQIPVPYGKIKKVYFPWKCLSPKFRRKDICLGYRLQLKDFLERRGELTVGSYTARDIPEFLLQKSSEWLS